MTAHRFALFDTPIGQCAIAWGVQGVVRVQLPEGRELATRARVLEQFPEAREDAPPPDVKRSVDAIVALLRGDKADLSVVPLDMQRVPPFHRRVYEVARSIAPGETVSYGEIAARLGAPGSARAVGQALGRNPFAIVVPCHRVLAAGARVGGFSANGGIATKLRLLSLESAHTNGARALFDGDGALAFDPRVAIDHLRSSDAVLARLMDSVGPFRMQVDKTSSVFVALAEAIVYQQLTGKAAATIFARVRALFPRAHDRRRGRRPAPSNSKGPTAEQLLRVKEEKLRAAGLSRSKLLSLRDLAQRAKNGEIPTLAEICEMDDQAIIDRLTEVRGIGRWTVEMLLMFRLGRPDVLPIDDYGLRKGFAIAFGKGKLPGRDELERRGARWKPYRTAASWYLWRAVELAQK